MSKKTETKNDPWKPAQPYILQNLQDTKQTYDVNQPKLQNFATMQQDTYGRLAPGSEAGIVGAQSLVNRNLSGANLMGNPFLEGIIEKTRGNVTDRANANFSAAGRYGSGAHTGVLARELADAENSLRYQDYGVERGYQQSGIADAQNLMGGATGLLNNAAQLPWVGVQAQNGGTNSLTNGYGVTTTKTSDPMGAITGLAGAAATAYASDPKVKRNVVPLGQAAPDGSPLYEYDNLASGRRETGVMATEVAPDARGPDVGGIKTVDYGKIGMNGPIDMGPVDTASLKQNIPTIDKPGFSGFLDRVVNPDQNTTRGKIGVLGHYLMAAEGSPFEGLGKGLILGRQEREKREDDERRFGIQERNASVLEALRTAQLGKIEAGPQPTAGLRGWQEWNALPPNQREAARPFFSGAALDPSVQAPLVAQRTEARQQLRGTPTFAQANPRNVGKPPSVRATKVVGGKAYYNIGGRWYDNAGGL